MEREGREEQEMEMQKMEMQEMELRGRREEREIKEIVAEFSLRAVALP